MSILSPKLKKITCEPEFWILLAMSLPGLVAGASESVRAAWDAALGHNVSFDPQAVKAALTGSPLVVYLSVGRQIARKGAAIGVGHQLAAQAQTTPDLETNPPTGVDDPEVAEPIPGDEEEVV